MLAVSPAEGGKWWKTPWRYRCGVTFEKKDEKKGKKKIPPPGKLPGVNVGVVTFRTGGHMRKDGGDIRVVTSRGREVSHRVLMIGPGDLVRVAFALLSDVPKYYVYFGNPKATGAEKSTLASDAATLASPLDIQRGVLMEMWRYNGGNARNLKEARDALGRAKKAGLIGRIFRDRMFSGHNPFGAQSGIVGVYTGHFLAPVDGEYSFAISSRNASFLLVNDKLLIGNGGWHGPHRRVRKQNKIKLQKGLNKLTFYHVSPRGDPIAVVMWKPPGKKWHLIPPAVFTPVLRGQGDPIEQYGRPVNIDFNVGVGGETFLENRYYQRRSFEPAITGRSDHGITWRWDFGDGQKGSGKKVEHVYLRAGIYPVKLTGEGYLRPLEITHRLSVDRPWDRVTVNKLDLVAEHAKMVAKYELSALDTSSNFEVVLLFRRAKDFKSMLKGCEAFIKRPKAAPREIQKLLPIYVDALLVNYTRTRAATAVKVLMKASTMTGTPHVAADMIVRAGHVTLGPLEDPDGAKKLFERVVTEYGTKTQDPVIRRAKIGLGDAWRAKGNYVNANKAYEVAGITDERAKSFRAIVKGDFARQVEEYLRRKDFSATGETLDKWELTTPADKLEGYSTLLRVKLYNAMKRPRDAAREAEVLLKVNPTSTYAPELLMQAHQAYKSNKQPQKARKALQRIVKSYRESPLFPEAVKILKEEANRKKAVGK